MNNEDYQHFVCIVAGDNYKTLMEDYDKNKQFPPYVVYKYADADSLRQKYIEAYANILDSDIQAGKEYIKDCIEELTEMTADEFYEEITEGYDIDEATGDAISTANKDGKWTSYKVGKMMSVPFLTKSGKEVFQAKKGDIDWDKIHLAGGDIYARAWEMVMEGKKPENDYEQQILDNMGDKQAYFKKFETKENYVASNTAFWGYSFLSEKTGWKEISDTDDQFVWMKNYYDLFIKNLPDDTQLTILECRK